MKRITRDQWRNVALIVPLLLVNLVAVSGQVSWAQEHLDAGWWMPYVFAASVESLGLFLAAEAHAALMAGDAALRLKLGAYAVAAAAGALNYAHWAGPGMSPTATAVTFGALSTLSPVLWSIRSRSMHRDQLRGQGLIDPRTVRFSAARWVLYPRATFEAMRLAVWVGEQEPMRAIELASPAVEVQPPPPDVSEVTVTVEPSKQAPKPDADRSRIVNAIVRDLRAGKRVSVNAVKTTHKVGHAKATEYLTEATERAEASRVVPIGGHS